MDYRDLVFLSVAENLSLSRAAEELFISQPAVTRHIKELEGKLGIALFDRKGSKIYLTNAGRLVYSNLREIRDRYWKMELEIGQLKGLFVGRLNIGASSTIMQYVLPKILAAFNARFPNIELLVINGNSFEMERKLHDNEIDIALVENESVTTALRYVDFMRDEIVPITSSDSVYAKRKQISVDELYSIPLVLREKGSGTLEVIRKSLERVNLDFEALKVHVHLGSTEAIKNYLSNFNGLALVSEKAIQSCYHSQNLTRLDLTGVSFTRMFRICLKQGQESYNAGLFVNFLSQYNY